MKYFFLIQFGLFFLIAGLKLLGFVHWLNDMNWWCVTGILWAVWAVLFEILGAVVVYKMIEDSIKKQKKRGYT